MALTRVALASIVAGELAETLTLGGLAATDASGALKEPLDRTLRALGVTESELATATVTDGREAAAIAFAIYFALARTLDALAARMDVAVTPGPNVKRHQQYDNVKARMQAALATAQFYGLPLALDPAATPMLVGAPAFTGSDCRQFRMRDAGAPPTPSWPYDPVTEGWER